MNNLFQSLLDQAKETSSPENTANYDAQQELYSYIKQNPNASFHDVLEAAHTIQNNYAPKSGSQATNSQANSSWVNGINGGIINPLADQQKQTSNETAGATEQKSEQPSAPAIVEAPKNDSSDNDVVEYTYKSGDTFGQVLLDLGLSDASGSNLWGDDGDVAYYTQQLREQGALDQNGNIPVGTKVKLRKKAVSAPINSWAWNQNTNSQTYGPYYQQA